MVIFHSYVKLPEGKGYCPLPSLITGGCFNVFYRRSELCLEAPDVQLSPRPYIDEAAGIPKKSHPLEESMRLVLKVLKYLELRILDFYDFGMLRCWGDGPQIPVHCANGNLKKSGRK